MWPENQVKKVFPVKLVLFSEMQINFVGLSILNMFVSATVLVSLTQSDNIQ